MQVSDYSIDAIKRRYDEAQEFFDRAEQLKTPFSIFTHSEENQRYLKMVQFETKSYMKSYELKGYLLPPVTFTGGFQTVIPSLFNRKVNLK